MNRIFRLFTIVMLVAVSLVACNKNKDDDKNKPGNGSVTAESLVGEWALDNVDGQSADFSVYIAFNEDGTCVLYQQVYSLDYVGYVGLWSLDGNRLTGEYIDGTMWKSDYILSLSADGKTLSMKSDETNPITSVYVSTTIPEWVKSETSTRADVVEPFL